jgi:uncharacterized protein YeaO (DUF488 family)
VGEIPCYAGLLDETGRVPDPPAIRLRRVYDHGESGPGRTFLVDRVWPRGVAKDRLHLDGWLRDVAPSDELRKWFGHAPERWAEFQRRYRVELAQPERQAALRDLVQAARQGPVTLLYGAKDEEHNQAVVLRAVLLDLLGQPPPAGLARPEVELPPSPRQ